LLAALALAVGTSYIINRGRAKYAWVTIIPMVFVSITTLTAGWMNISNIYLPQIWVEKTQVQGIINLSLTTIIMASVVVIIVDAVPKWIQTILGKRALIPEPPLTAIAVESGTPMKP
jgi:carbon starvation protein